MEQGRFHPKPKGYRHSRSHSKTSNGKINIKKFKILSPNGQEFITDQGLTKFCEENGLTATNMHKVVQGKRKHHKGWAFIERIE